MKKKLTDTRRDGQRGFTLLLAALISAIVLMLGSAIFSIAQKQVILSSIGRDSQFAFYAADTASECALYQDIRQSAFGTASAPTVADIVCDKAVNGTDQVSHTSVVAGVNAATSTFSMDLFTYDVINGKTATSSNCAQVTVAKNPTPPYTVIHADGYSTPCVDINRSARALQRSVELHY